MRILRLTRGTERGLVAARKQRDVETERVADRIVGDVRRGGDPALERWCRELDKVDLQKTGLWIPQSELAQARTRVSSRFLQAARHAIQNVERVAGRQLPKPWKLTVEPDVVISQEVRPIDSIGCYVPAGRFALVSSLIMTVAPARVAGVREIVVVCPKPNDQLLAVAHLLGIRRISRIGGAQAIAALAYGTKRMPRVEKIFGPGNRYVTAAKQIVSRDCAIDLPAGPTEAVVLAADGNPGWIAAELVAQAEHATDAGSFLVTTSTSLARRVQCAVAKQLTTLPPENAAHQSLRRAGAILVAPSMSSACEFVNRFAPEHLSLPGNLGPLLGRVHSAGTVFLGAWAAQALGDYASGSNHVLPTAGWAGRRGGLSAADFVKCVSVQSIGRRGFERLAGDVQILARAEGMLAHANAIEVRR
jgi:histidinol dehydrogenase